MTDNEIIKALECCLSVKDHYTACKKCPIEPICESDDILLKYALVLINRQRAEIERLEKIRAKQAKFLGEERGQKYELLNKIGNSKSEAIKEFSEELEYFVLNEDIEVVEPKCKDYESYINGANQFRHQIKNGINNLVKEMTENINGKQ